MDIQLTELIEKIKTDGVKIAEEKAAAIISAAEEKAAVMVRTASTEADRLRKVAQVDADRTIRSGNEALRQAGRDLVLTVKGEIQKLFDKVLKEQVTETLDGQLIAAAVGEAIKSLSKIPPEGVEIQVSERDLAGVEQAVRTNLASKFADGLEIRPFRGLDAGFRISQKDGSAFYDFSENEIAAMLSKFLNARLTQLLSE